MRFVATLVLSVVFVASLDMGVRGALLGTRSRRSRVLFLLFPEYSSRAAPSVAVAAPPDAGFGLPFFPVLLGGLADRGLRPLPHRVVTDTRRGRLVRLGYRVAAVMQIAVAAFSMGWAPLRYRSSAATDAL